MLPGATFFLCSQYIGEHEKKVAQISAHGPPRRSGPGAKDSPIDSKPSGTGLVAVGPPVRKWHQISRGHSN